jgi:hypothetical protein
LDPIGNAKTDEVGMTSGDKIDAKNVPTVPMMKHGAHSISAYTIGVVKVWKKASD